MTNNLPQNVSQIKSLANNAEIKKRVVDMLGERGANLFINSVISVATSTLQNVEPNSIFACALKACALRLPIDPQLKYAALIPYGGVCSLQIMVDGYKNLAMRSGKVKKFIAEVVYADEFVSWNPFEQEIVLNPPKADGERYKATAEPIGYYAKCVLKDGYEEVVYATKSEMEKHRDRYSQMYKKNPKMSKWTDEFDKMALKTLVKKLIKSMGIMGIEEAVTLAEVESQEEPINNVIESTFEVAEEKKAKGRKIQRDDDIIDAVVADKEKEEQENLEELEAFGG